MVAWGPAMDGGRRQVDITIKGQERGILMVTEIFCILPV